MQRPCALNRKSFSRRFPNRTHRQSDGGIVPKVWENRKDGRSVGKTRHGFSIRSGRHRDGFSTGRRDAPAAFHAVLELLQTRLPEGLFRGCRRSDSRVRLLEFVCWSISPV